jgi:DNA-binding transcriptional LysR family regulator
LACALLNRTTRRLSLTRAGAALFEASRGAIERIEEAEAAVRALPEGAAGGYA